MADSSSTGNSDPQISAVASLIRAIPDFPEPGIMFRDITPLLADPKGLQQTVSLLSATVGPGCDYIVSVDARGFIMGSPVAAELGIGFVPVRKPGKLPGATFTEKYELEYGSGELQMHEDAMPAQSKVWLIDDLIATGGTLKAACALVERAGGQIEGITALIELVDLAGSKQLDGYPFTSLIRY